MSLTVSPMEEADFPVMTQLFHKAYYSTTGVSALLYHTPPSQASLDKITQVRLRAFHEDSNAHFIKATDSETGEIIACARWDIYKHARSDDDVERSAAFTDDDLIPEFNVDVHAALFGPLRRAHKDVMGTRPHAYLVGLVTDPDHGRRGAGGLLVQWGLDQADELGLDTYLDASPMGKGLYEKNGFETVKDIPFDLVQFGGEGAISHTVSTRLTSPDSVLSLTDDGSACFGGQDLQRERSSRPRAGRTWSDISACHQSHQFVRREHEHLRGFRMRTRFILSSLLRNILDEFCAIHPPIPMSKACRELVFILFRTQVLVLGDPATQSTWCGDTGDAAQYSFEQWDPNTPRPSRR